MLTRLPFFTRHNIEPISFRLHTFLFFYCSFYFFSKKKKKWLYIRKGALDYHRQTHTSSQHLLLQDVSWLLLIVVLVAQVRSNRDERNTQNNHFPFIHPIHQRRSRDEENKRSKVRHSSSSMPNKNAPCVCSTQVLPPEGSEAFSTVFLKLSFYQRPLLSYKEGSDSRSDELMLA